MAATGVCARCGAKVVWQQSAKSGRPMICDPPVLQVVDEQGVMHRGRQSHWGTCPKAAEVRAEYAGKRKNKAPSDEVA